MADYSDIGLLAGGLFLTAVSTMVLLRSLERVGNWLKFSEGVLGLATAVGANTPEIASAISSMGRGHHDVGLGVILGSNIFNLAALLGLSALVAGQLKVRTQAVIFSGGLAVAACALIAALALGVMNAWWMLALLCLLFTPYVAVLSVSEARVVAWRLPDRLARFLVEAAKGEAVAAKDTTIPARVDLTDAVALIPALATIILGSIAMVTGAEGLVLPSNPIETSHQL